MNRYITSLAALFFPILFSTLFLPLWQAEASPIEPPPWSWRKGSFGFSSTTEYFSTNANYDATRGSFTRLTGDNRLTDFNTWLRGRYAFWPKFSMYAGLGAAQVRALDTTSEKTTSGLTEGYIGGHFTLLRKWVLMVAEVEAGMPFDAGGPMKSFSSTQTAPLIDDGVYYGRALLHVRRDIKALRLFGHFGAKIPTSGLAKTLLYGLYGEFPIGDYLMVGGGIDGQETMMHDELTAAERSLTHLSTDAGSARFRPFDPAVLNARGWVGFRPGQTVEIRAGYMQTINGQRAAQGQSYLLSVVFNSMPSGKSRVKFNTGERISAPGNTGPFKLDSEKADPDVIAPTNDFEPQNKDDLNETERLFD